MLLLLFGNEGSAPPATSQHTSTNWVARYVSRFASIFHRRTP